jgi:hypothetical protein
MENTQSMTLVNDDSGNSLVADLTTRKTTFCSFVASTDAEKSKLFKIMNNPEKRLKECTNMTLEITDVFAEIVDCVNKETGEYNKCPRIVLIDKNGVGYVSVSLGVYNSIKKLFEVFGVPTWAKPVKIKPILVSKGERSILSLDIA